MGLIRVLGQDPAFTHYGLAMVDVDPVDLSLHPVWIDLVVTKKSTNKKVRVASDKLERARQLTQRVRAVESEASITAAEIPTGAQSANAANALGIALGIVAGHSVPLIEVTAAEVKKAATGYSDASKGDMVAWAYERWPDLQWKTSNKGAKDMPPGLSANNEHMADALATVLAATKTENFKSVAAVLSRAAA